MRLLWLAALLASATTARADEACKTPEALRLEAAAAAVKARLRDPHKVAREVHGLHLRDGERALHSLEVALGKRPPESFAKAAAARCETVVCALEQILGEQEAALWFLVIAAESGAPPSLDQAGWEVESVWQPQELRALARALLEAPPELKRVSTLKVWRRLPSGQKLRKGAIYNAVSYLHDQEYGNLGTIVIRDTVWKFHQRDQRAVVQHELGHHWELSRQAEGRARPSLSADWLQLSGWHTRSGKHSDHPDEYVLGAGFPIATAGEGMPTEDFADSIANYRYAPRLMRAYSTAKFDYMHRMLGKDHLRPDPDPELDAAWKATGGALQAVRECAAHVQRAWADARHHQTDLYAVFPKQGGGTHWELMARNQFVVKSGCAKAALEKLQAAPGWQEVTCRQDLEDVEVAVTDRLEEVWAAFAEAAARIRAEVPAGQAEECLRARDLTLRCFAGAAGQAAADREAGRLLGEFHGGDQAGREELARALLLQTPLTPSDDELRARFPVLQSSGDLFFACVRGARKISLKSDHWLFWVTLPGGETRGFKDAVWQPACQRDFAAHLAEAGIKVDAADPLLEHFAYLLKNQTGPLLEGFAQKVLQHAAELKGHCSDAACSAGWLKPRLHGLVPPALEADLARHLAETLHP